MAFSIKQRQQFRAQAHALKPVVIIGSHGLTDAVQKEIDHALEDHELIKIRINAPTRSDRQAILKMICEKQVAEEVQCIGHIGIIYRKRKKEGGKVSVDLISIGINPFPDL